MKMMSLIAGKNKNIYDFFSKNALYLLVFLLPIFFMPWSTNVLDFNKQAVLMLLVSVSLLFWLLKFLTHRSIKINLNSLYVPLALYLLVFGIATFFSMFRYGSIWGTSSIFSETFMTVLFFGAFFVLASSILDKKELTKTLFIFIGSSLVALLYGTLQLFGAFILPFSFSKNPNFNTIGSANSLAFFAALLIPLTFFLVIGSKTKIKWLFVGALFLEILILFSINFQLAWIAVAIGSAIIVVFGVQKGEFFKGGTLILPMFLLAISLFFVFFSNFQIPLPVSRPVEFFLNQRTSYSIALETIKERPLFGSGPATFAYDFAKEKSTEFNNSLFWNVRFEKAGSKIAGLLATTGILGVASLIALLITILLYGTKKIIKGTSNVALKTEEAVSETGAEAKEFYNLAGTGAFISFLALAVSYFFYSSNFMLDFMLFFLMAIIAGFFCIEKKELILKSSSVASLAVTFAITVVFIANLGVLISGGQIYVAEIYHSNSAMAYNGGELDRAIKMGEKAVMTNPKSEVFWRDLSQIYLNKLNVEINREDASDEQLNQRVRELVQSSISSAMQATEINPNNSANWSVRGFVYQNLIPIYPGFEEWVHRSYEEAIKLDPTNPYYYNQQGRAVLTFASTLKEDQKQEIEKKLEEAKEKFERAVELKPDYAPALFQISVIYQTQGKTDEAISQLKKAQDAAPFDIGLAFQLGLAYYRKGDYRNAVSELEKARNIDPNYANALYFLGLSYDKLGDKNKAIEMISKVADTNPENDQVLRILNNLRNGRGALEEVVENVPPQTPIEETPEEIQE